MIKKAINKAISPNIKNLRLFDIIIIKGFYINIVSEARLNKISVTVLSYSWLSHVIARTSVWASWRCGEAELEYSYKPNPL